jgi:hypothetical protein
MSSLSMVLFNKLILDVAVCQLAVDDFEVIAGQDNPAAFAAANLELDTVKLALIRHVLREGNLLTLNIVAEQLERAIKPPSLPTSSGKAGIWKSQL